MPSDTRKMTRALSLARQSDNVLMRIEEVEVSGGAGLTPDADPHFARGQLTADSDNTIYRVNGNGADGGADNAGGLRARPSLGQGSFWVDSCRVVLRASLSGCDPKRKFDSAAEHPHNGRSTLPRSANATPTR